MIDLFNKLKCFLGFHDCRLTRVSVSSHFNYKLGKHEQHSITLWVCKNCGKEINTKE